MQFPTSANSANSITVPSSSIRQSRFEKLDDENLHPIIFHTVGPPKKIMFCGEKWCRFKENRMTSIFF
jgi:hypothetical protein